MLNCNFRWLDANNVSVVEQVVDRILEVKPDRILLVSWMNFSGGARLKQGI
jgi:hypothetical protein